VTFQASAGADGKALAFVGLNEEGPDGNEDMFLVRFDGRQWGEPSNLTQNETRAARQNRLDVDQVRTWTRYVPRFGAGVLGPDGQANLVLVNDELTSMAAGTDSDAHAFFVKR
jgi:hypothetical protein